jgi:metal-responsive CopG/Arc/MetJ family transcriptional regulator
MESVRVSCRIPKNVIDKLDKIDDEATRSYMIRRAVNEFCSKEIDKLLKKYKI